MLKAQTKKITAFMSVVAMLFSMLLYFPSGIFGNISFGLKASAATITPSQPSGYGTSDNPYKIRTAGQLYWFADKVNNENSIYRSANAVLTADITVNSNLLGSLTFDSDGNVSNGTDFTSWTPISNNFNQYTGTFDGQNHTISGLYFNDTNTNYVGLFGNIYDGGAIKNVGVVDSYFKGRSAVGGVCGYKDYGTITNCYNTGAISGINEVGGVCGNNVFGTITNCYNTGAVSGSKYVGGVCGWNDGTITNCYYDSDKYSGNAVGENSSSSTATDVEGKTTAQFNRGEVAYLLSKGCTIGRNTYDGSVWGQTIGTDNYPVLGGAKVYATTGDCVTYNNDGITDAKEHNFTSFTADTHSCIDCGLTESHDFGEDNVCTVCNTYIISTADQLYWFAGLVNGTLEDVTQDTSVNAVLTADITVNTGDVANCGGVKADGWTDWTPIGNNKSYTGTFDGQEHTISGLYFNDANTYYVGLFGQINGTVKNVGVVDSYFNGKLIVGGVCGRNDIGTITNCYNTGTVSGSGSVGGVCGQNSSTITNCYNTGKVSATGDYTGGVCGYNLAATITNCYNTGTVSGTGKVGGVCGYNRLVGSSTSEITNCYNTGTVSGTDDYIGGVCGYNKGTIENCYYDKDKCSVKGINNADGTGQAEGKTTAEFNSGEVAYLLSQGENGELWGQTIGTEDYPILGGKKVLANVDQSAFANDIIVYGQSASLDGTIGFNIYVSADDSYEWNTTIGGVTGVKNKDGLYVFTYNVAAKDMDESINFTVNDKIDVTVSVSKYLDELSKTDNESLKNLADSMSAYGNAAKALFSNGTVAEQTIADDLSVYDFTVAMPEGISYYGSSLILESETTVRHYFKLDAEKNIDEFTFTIDGNKVIPGEKSGYYYIDVKNISAENLGVGHTVKIGDTEVISGYSALSYAKAVLNSTAADDNLKNLVKTIYLYNQAAVGYNMKTGWVQDGGNWYYFDDDGIMQTGWVTGIPGFEGKWFYFADNGIMQTGWVTGIPGFEGKWFYFADNGIMQTNCFVQNGENWYYSNDDGTMRTGWLQYGGNWYYFGDDGIMQTSRWVQDGENWYYLNDDGTLLTNSYTPDGYYVDENGIWIPGK